MLDLISTSGKWKLSFGPEDTFATREEARLFIKEDPHKKFMIMKPQPIPNESYVKPLPKEEKPIQTFDSPIKFVKAKKPPLEGKDAFTRSLNALDELATVIGFHWSHKGHPHDLYIEVLECTIRECRPCNRKECPVKDDTQKCWAEDRLAAFTDKKG